MTLFDFIYMVGFSVSFIMGLSVITQLNEEQKEKAPFASVLICALLCAYYLGDCLYIGLEEKFTKESLENE